MGETVKYLQNYYWKKNGNKVAAKESNLRRDLSQLKIFSRKWRKFRDYRGFRTKPGKAGNFRKLKPKNKHKIMKKLWTRKIPGSVHPEDEFLIFIETSSPLHPSIRWKKTEQTTTTFNKPRNEGALWPLKKAISKFRDERNEEISLRRRIKQSQQCLRCLQTLAFFDQIAEEIQGLPQHQEPPSLSFSL